MSAPRTCIKMSNGNVYVVDMPLDAVATKLRSSDDLVLVPAGMTGKDSFFINPLQVCAVYPAKS